MQITYKTGRTYSTEQVLQITVEQDTQDEFEMHDIVATFVDVSRGIMGRVEATVYGSDSIGDAVLRKYDAGHYATI